MKNKRELSTKIAKHLIGKYDLNVFPNHLAKEIRLVIIKFEEDDLIRSKNDE